MPSISISKFVYCLLIASFIYLPILKASPNMFVLELIIIESVSPIYLYIVIVIKKNFFFCVIIIKSYHKEYHNLVFL